MCISATMMLAISSAVGAVGAISQGMQQKGQADQQAAERRYAADQDRADAEAERGAAEVRAGKLRKAGRMQVSSARSSLAKSGVVADAGSAQTIQDYITASSEEDALAEMWTGEARAKRLQAQGAAGDREAGYLTQSGKNAMTSGILGAGKSLLGGYATYRSPGWKVQQA